MKIVFMGTPPFAAVSLQKILASEHSVLAVVTVQDKPQGRGRKVKPSEVKKVAVHNKIEILQPERLKDSIFIKELRGFNADLFVVVAFKILPREVFTIPPKGTLNVHASLLPKYRGAAPINWAIIKGEKETGVTTMLIDEKVDTGGILLQDRQQISPDMTAGELHDLLAEKGSRLLIRTLDLLDKGRIKPKEQENRLASKAPKITKELCHIDFNKPAVDVFNLIRGLDPYPAAFTFHKGHLLKIFKSSYIPIRPKKAEPGTIIETGKDSFTVACNPGSIKIFEVQLEGKRRMAVHSFFNGYRLLKGEHLT